MVQIAVNDEAVLKTARIRINNILRDVGPMVVKSAIRKVPVDTGNLLRSITHENEDLKLTVGSRVHYAGYVEGGTPKMSAQPYLRPALIENLREIKKLFKRI